MRKWILTALICMASTFTVAASDFKENIEPNIYMGLVVSVYDGDTFTVRISTWHRTIKEVKIRLLGVNTPEVRGDSKVEGKKIRDYVRGLILDKLVWVYPSKTGKYGRTLAQIELTDGRDLGELLIKKGYAVVYMADNIPVKLK